MADVAYRRWVCNHVPGPRGPEGERPGPKGDPGDPGPMW